MPMPQKLICYKIHQTFFVFVKLKFFFFYFYTNYEKFMKIHSYYTSGIACGPFDRTDLMVLNKLGKVEIEVSTHLIAHRSNWSVNFAVKFKKKYWKFHDLCSVTENSEEIINCVTIERDFINNNYKIMQKFFQSLWQILRKFPRENKNLYRFLTRLDSVASYLWSNHCNPWRNAVIVLELSPTRSERNSALYWQAWNSFRRI